MNWQLTIEGTPVAESTEVASKPIVRKFHEPNVIHFHSAESLHDFRKP